MPAFLFSSLGSTSDARWGRPMSELEVAYHKRWLNMLAPVEGLVVSVPVLVEAECMEKRDAELSRQLADDAAAVTRIRQP
jgi:hypothetical protein